MGAERPGELRGRTVPKSGRRVQGDFDGSRPISRPNPAPDSPELPKTPRNGEVPCEQGPELIRLAKPVLAHACQTHGGYVPFANRVHSPFGARHANSDHRILRRGADGPSVAAGFIQARLVNAGQIVAADPFPTACEGFAQAVPGSKVFADNAQVCAAADILVLATKPQQVAEALRPLGEVDRRQAAGFDRRGR